MPKEVLYCAKKLYSDDWVVGYFIPELKESIEGKTVESGFLRVHSKMKDGSYRVETVEILRSSLCEFTGAYDKNGSRIFEFDILKDISNKLYRVEHSAKNACFFAHHGKKIFLVGNLVDIEVVGNLKKNSSKTKNEDNYVLSGSSKHLPTYKECMSCKFSNECNSGSKCVVKTKGNKNYENNT